MRGLRGRAAEGMHLVTYNHRVRNPYYGCLVQLVTFCTTDAFGDIQSSCTSTMLVQAMAYWIMIGFGDNTIRIPVGNH